MGYKIQQAFCWFNNESEIVKMYFINQIPFTFDELAKDAHLNPQLVKLADGQRRFSTEDLYRSSFYLIDEECHPCLFEMDIDNPEDMPENFDIE